MAPTFVQSYVVTLSALTTAALVTPSFTPGNGEVIVIKAVGADKLMTWGSLPTGGSLTYTSRQSVSTANFCSLALWTAVVGASPGSMTVSVTPSGNANWHSMVVERWSNAALATTPATATPTTGSGSGPSSVVTTTAANSVVSWADGDWSATSPATKAYRSSATEDGIHDGSTSQYVAYYAYQSAVSVGAQTIGLTAPTQTWSMLGVEVKSSGAAVAQPSLPYYSNVARNRAALW